MTEQEQVAQMLAKAGTKKTLHLTDYESEVCPKCGSKLFTTAIVIKDIPGVAVGRIESKTVPMPIDNFPVYVCAKCGELAPAMHSDPELNKMVKKLLGEEESEEKKPETQLIV